MNRRLLFPILFCAILPASLTAGLGPQEKLKPPKSKSDEMRDYHLPPVKGMAASTRLDGYEKRLRMERDGIFSQVKWRNVGPVIQSGRVVDIESPADHPEVLYIAYATGGLWRTEDDGINWTPLFDNESCFAIGDFAVSRDGKTIWVGTGENNSQRTSYSGTGVFKSVDAGKTWQNMGLAETHRVGRVVIDPKNENTVYVAAIGSLYSQNSERGVYKTTDGGKTWDHILSINEHTGVIDLAMDPRDSRVLYAAAWDRDRRAWNFRESGPGSALYKTTNGGKTWEKLTNGLPFGEAMGRTGVAVSKSNPNVVYAFIDNQAPDPETAYEDEFTPSGELTPRRFLLLSDEQFQSLDKKVLERFLERQYPEEAKPKELADKLLKKEITRQQLAEDLERREPGIFRYGIHDAEIYCSNDSGKSWRLAQQGRIGSHGAYYCGRITVHPTNPDIVYTTGWRMLKSSDGGKTWADTAGDKVHVDFHVYWIDPHNLKHHVLGSDGGLYDSYDDGKTWRRINNMPTGQFTTIAVDNKRPYNIYGGTQDNGTLKGPSSHKLGESDPNEWKYVGWGDGSAIAVDWKDDDIVYVAWQFGNHEGTNQKTGERWKARAEAKFGEPPLRYNWISPLIISPHHPDILYLGAQKVFRSLDKGKTWEPISDDLTKNRPNGDVPYSCMKELSESPLKFGLIYAAGDDGNLHVTKDHGNSWTPIPTPQPDKWISRVVASKYDVATVYVSQSGYREDDFAPYLWKSTDYGAIWVSIAGDLPTETINVVREDPQNKDILYVGTDLGVWVTLDGGIHWEPLNGEIPRTPVHDLVIQAREQEMAIATHARSIWIASIKPFHKLTADIRAKALHLFDLGEMERGRRWGYDWRNPWDRSPISPPLLKGEFWTQASGKATLSLKDKDGNVVKSQGLEAAKGYNAFEFSLELEPAKPGTANPKGRDVSTLEQILADPLLANRPKYVEAGEYTLELAIGDQKVSVPWKLKAAER